MNICQTKNSLHFFLLNYKKRISKIKYCIIIPLFLLSCKKHDDTPTPVASFVLDTNNPNSNTLIASDYYQTVNTSTDAESYSWDFGNKSKSTNKNPSLTYSLPGIYTITLTSNNNQGKKSIVSKKVTVLNRLVKTIFIDFTNQQNLFQTISTKSDIWVEILRGDNGSSYNYTSNNSFNAPLIYKSLIIKGIPSNNTLIKVDVQNKLAIDLPALLIQNGYNGIGYVFNVYAQENSKTVLLFSNLFSGQNLKYDGDIYKNNFSIKTGILELQGNFE